jgi:aminomethyltransferase
VLWSVRMNRTPLYDTHVALGARMVEFAGWSMPVHYPSGIQQEHIAVRSDVGLFDVSHMGELRVIGEDATAFLQYATLNDPGRLKLGRGQYNMLPNDRGGLIDDIYVYRERDDEYQIVVNAANVARALAQLRTLAEGFTCHVVDESSTWALMALQGPGSALLLGRVVDDDLTRVRKNATLLTTVSGCPVKVSRTGYTGEDGFELFCHPTDASIVWDVLTHAGALPCGLGARDTLRLEAGFPLYGHELDDTTNPLCTAFAWVVKDKPFFGREAMWDRPCPRRLVGLKLVERGIARQGYRVFFGADVAGEITSGTLSPLTRESIAFAWVDAAAAAEGTAIEVEIRGQRVAASVVAPPFFGQ